MDKKIIFISSIISLILLVSNVYAFCIDKEPPSAPTNLEIHDSPYDGDGNITLTWTAATDGPCEVSAVAYYNIYRSNDSVNFTLIGNTILNAFDDFSSLPEGTYHYRVTAVDNVIDNPHEGPAVEGSTIVGQAPSPPPAPPAGGGGGGGGGAGAPVQPCELNGICDSWETHENCPSDCPEETTTATTPGAGETECQESWVCSGWKGCVNGLKKRTCMDENNCGTEIDKPVISESCSAEEIAGGGPSVLGFLTGMAAGLTTTLVENSIYIILFLVLVIILIVIIKKKYKQKFKLTKTKQTKKRIKRKAR